MERFGDALLVLVFLFVVDFLVVVFFFAGALRVVFLLVVDFLVVVFFLAGAFLVDFFVFELEILSFA